MEAKSIVRWLFEELGINYIDIYAYPDVEMELSHQERLNDWIQKLKEGIPVQYVVGYTVFYDMKLYVSPSCLIPRPETEEMISIVQKQSKKYQSVLDIGTGSGCIALALRKIFPEAKIHGVDLSADALSVAQKNSVNLSMQVAYIQDDILNPDHSLYPGFFDLIVSNPPYVKESEKMNMHRNVLDFEPEAALFVSDKDPLLFYKAIKSFAEKKLTSGGELFLEINEAHGSETAELFGGPEFLNTRVIKDLHGKDRFIKTVSNG